MGLSIIGENTQLGLTPVFVLDDLQTSFCSLIIFLVSFHTSAKKFIDFLANILNLANMQSHYNRFFM